MSEEYSPKNDPQFNPLRNPTEVEYNLRAKVWVVDTYAKQGEKGGAEKIKAVVLVPQESDETTKFFNAWLPEGHDHIVEVLADFGSPIFGTARMAVQRPSKNYPHGPHLFVMHKWLEDILKNKNFHLIEFKTKRGTEDAQEFHEVDQRDTEADVTRIP